VLAGGALVGAASLAHSLALLRTQLENPHSGSFRGIFETLGAAVVLLAGGLAWAVVRARIQRHALARIVVGVPQPGSLETALGRALRDPQLRIAYWLSASQRYADARGRPLPDPGPDATTIVRDRRRIAAVTHSAALPELERELGAAVRLALENERLQAELLAQLEDLRASRTRIVETADAERRRLEHDLHDGAQQRLLALSYEIRLARAATDGVAADLLADAAGEAQAALDELRDLAHGIYPASLADAGLSIALQGLAETARLPVELGQLPRDRYPPAVETAAYVAAAEAIEDAARRRATFAELRVQRENGLLVVEVDDDGVAHDSPLTGLADRVGALGGRIELGRTTLRAELPLGG
jgi:signal transduction histidine kinase